jgi:hypothetical protein
MKRYLTVGETPKIKQASFAMECYYTSPETLRKHFMAYASRIDLDYYGQMPSASISLTPRRKESQVQLMRTIYSGAKRTLIWLGRVNDRQDQDMSAFAKLSIKIGLASLRSRVDPSECPKIAVVDTRTNKSRILLPFSSEFYLALICMLRKPWFQRAWVVQEVTVSRKATILWDYVEYDWDDVVQALKYMSTVQFPLAFIVSLQHIAAIRTSVHDTVMAAITSSDFFFVISAA